MNVAGGVRAGLGLVLLLAMGSGCQGEDTDVPSGPVGLANPASVYCTGLGYEEETRTNDGVVPTLSQAYGTFIDAVVGDHLDIVGQFHNSGGEPMADWLPSGSHFDESRFARVWDNVARFIVEASP